MLYLTQNRFGMKSFAGGSSLWNKACSELLGLVPWQISAKEKKTEDLFVRHVRILLAKCAKLQRQHLVVG